MSVACQIPAVMAGLVPAIHDLLACRSEDVDARHKVGHDDEESLVPHIAAAYGICHD